VRRQILNLKIVCIIRTEYDLKFSVNVILNCYCRFQTLFCHVFQEFISYIRHFALHAGGEYEHIEYFILFRAKIYKNTQWLINDGFLLCS
jgi:hypothetical protein